MIHDRPTYATPRAADGALSRGFDLSRGDWRDVFLAVTDVMAAEGPRSGARHVRASYVGPVRQGEGWAVVYHGRRFDVLYDPHQALILSVADPRP
jgi:hypothetical protein